MTKADVVRPKLLIDEDIIKKLKLVIVAYSNVDRDMFATDEAYDAEIEVVDRAHSVVAEIEKLGIPAKAYPADEYFITKILVDKPDLVLNLVDTFKGKESLSTSIPASLELLGIQFTGADTTGMLIGSDRYLNYQLLKIQNVPITPFQYIKRSNTRIKQEEIPLPLIVKLNESGGSVGIDNHAVKETYEAAAEKVKDMISTYKMPVVVEHFVDGREVTVCVLDDGSKKHVFMAEKIFGFLPDGKHKFTSFESYERDDCYTFHYVDEKTYEVVKDYAVKAFNILKHRDYAKFDVRIDVNNVPFFTDSNPNTAFGPDMGLPFTDILNMHKVPFNDILRCLLTKHAKLIQQKDD